MVRVLIIGASGFIGPRVAVALREAGHEVWSASRNGAGVNGLALDRGDPSAASAAVRTYRIERVIDLIAYDAKSTASLLEALDGSIERYVLASSGDVYRNYEGLHRRASPPIDQSRLAEDSPLRTTRYPYRLSEPRSTDDPNQWLDDYDKIEVEAQLVARPSLSGVIVRLPMVYGPGDHQRRFRWILKALQNGVAIEAPGDWLNWRTSYGFVDDVASALALAATHDDAGGRAFNVGDIDPPSHREWIALFAKALGKREVVRKIPMHPDSPLAALDLRYPLVLDTTVIRTVLGWSESTGLMDALARTAADERPRG